MERFDLAGQYVGQFGSAGSGPGQFSLDFPMGIASDSKGHIWVSDPNNNRVQQWLLGNFASPIAEELKLNDGDAQVDVESAGGLVSAVTGGQAGGNVYQHVGNRLTSHMGPEGETKYSYDSAGRMTKVTLPNGTWGEITYNQTYGRVKSVTVDPAGAPPAKKTEFEFSDEPRRTVVIPSDAPHVTYDIGADGSVLKWWNALQPPIFDDIAGTLYDNRGKELVAGDHNLSIQAHSEEGIASIQVLANGNTLVDEKACEKAKVIECMTEIDEWVTSTDEHPPGRLDLEVIITDRLGQQASERFWVNVPPPPPPPAPGTPIPPKFRDIAKFREEYGLDIVDPVANEIELNERIFNLIKAWYEPETPVGQVARATMERWGVPLRPRDVAELEYREWLYHVNAERIDEWIEETSPASYAGYYMDHPAGGIMRVGFTDNQDEQLENLKTSLSLVAGERLQVYPTTPTASYISVQESSQSLSDAIESNGTLGKLVVSVSTDEAGIAVHVGTPDVAQVESILDQTLGPDAPITVEYDPGGGSLLSGRFRNEGRMRAGDAIFTRDYTFDYPPIHEGNTMCTAGFGAKDKAGELGGQAIWRLFVLTAGHCNRLNERRVYRSTNSDSKNEDSWRELGVVKRDALHQFDGVSTDAEAIRVDGDGIVPQGIFGWGGDLIPTKPAGKVRIGDTVCFSGARTQTPERGQVVARSTRWTGAPDGYPRGGYWVKFNEPAIPGDSGGPVWACGSGASIGLVTSGRAYGAETLVEPLLHPPNMASNQVVGILNNQYMAPLSLKLGE